MKKESPQMRPTSGIPHKETFEVFVICMEQWEETTSQQLMLMEKPIHAAATKYLLADFV